MDQPLPHIDLFGELQVSDQPTAAALASEVATSPLARVLRWTLGAGLVGIAGVLMLNQFVSRTDSSTVALSRSITKVNIVIQHGNVNIKTIEASSATATMAADNGTARLERQLTRSLRDPRENIQQHGNTLRVHASCDRPLTGRCSTDYRLIVPTHTQVTVRTETGTVTAKGLRGSLSAHTKVGNVRIADVRGGRLTAMSQIGNVTLSEVRFDRARARTRRGDVRVVTAQGFRELTASSETGDVVVTLPGDAGPYAVNAGTDDGTRQVEVGQDATARATVDVTTAVGDVMVSKV